MVGQIKIFFISSTKYISNNQQDYYPNSHQTIHVVSNQHNYCSLSWSYGYCVFMLWAGGMLEAKTICFCSFSVVSCSFVLLPFVRPVICFFWVSKLVLWSCNFNLVNINIIYYVIYAIKGVQSVSVLLSIEGYSPENLCQYVEISEIIIRIVHYVYSGSLKQCPRWNKESLEWLIFSFQGSVIIL